MLKKRLIRALALFAIAFGISAYIAWVELEKAKTQATVQPTMVTGVKIGGQPFELVDHTGAKVTQKTYEGRYKLLYFGYSFCPDVCPTDLQKITRVMEGLGDSAKNIQPIFVTIDPERDTVNQLSDYMELFHPSLVALTGTPAQIKHMLDVYRIYAAKIEPENNPYYTMNHSAYVYLMSYNDELIKVFSHDTKAEDIIIEIKNSLKF